MQAIDPGAAIPLLAAVHAVGRDSRCCDGGVRHPAGSHGFVQRRVDRVELMAPSDDLVQPITLGDRAASSTVDSLILMTGISL